MAGFDILGQLHFWHCPPSWVATIDVCHAARGLGISQSHLYELIKRDQVPFRVVAFGTRYRVITASLIRYLEAE
ncbi:helix-turn-helix domain-containing protein [Streptomyces sp. NPDC048581]|uniref:helix-turn-helix domain-containing protein n=1 Tax=unclassified Streptomyces TaxID=2593676 RepID=UPI003714AB3B